MIGTVATLALLALLLVSIPQNSIVKSPNPEYVPTDRFVPSDTVVKNFTFDMIPGIISGHNHGVLLEVGKNYTIALKMNATSGGVTLQTYPHDNQSAHFIEYYIQREEEITFFHFSITPRFEHYRIDVHDTDDDYVNFVWIWVFEDPDHLDFDYIEENPTWLFTHIIEGSLGPNTTKSVVVHYWPDPHTYPQYYSVWFRPKGAFGTITVEIVPMLETWNSTSYSMPLSFGPAGCDNDTNYFMRFQPLPGFYRLTVSTDTASSVDHFDIMLSNYTQLFEREVTVTTTVTQTVTITVTPTVTITEFVTVTQTQTRTITQFVEALGFREVGIGVIAVEIMAVIGILMYAIHLRRKEELPPDYEAEVEKILEEFQSEATDSAA